MVSAEIDDVEAEAIKASRQLHAEKLETLKKLRTEKLSEIDTKWTDERDNLERRVTECIEEIDLGDGTTVAVRTRLSELEVNRLTDILKIREELGEANITENAKLTYELLSMVTANPLFTQDYFSENQDKYSSIDLSNVIVAFYENLADRDDKVNKIQSFRKKQSRT